VFNRDNVNEYTHLAEVFIIIVKCDGCLTKFIIQIVQLKGQHFQGLTKKGTITARKWIVLTHLIDGMAELIIVAVECCKQLSFAPCSENPDDFLISISLVMDLILEYLGFRVCQRCVHLWAVIAVCAYKRHQKLR
jgi:hypothetical protein